MTQDLFEPKLNQKEAAKALHVSTRTLEGWRFHRCGPPFLKIGGRITYLQSDIAAFILAHRVAPSRRMGDRTSVPTLPESQPDYKSRACGRDAEE